jgi:hypothetical protein
VVLIIPVEEVAAEASGILDAAEGRRSSAVGVAQMHF